jgi:hypothetical protein
MYPPASSPYPPQDVPCPTQEEMKPPSYNDVVGKKLEEQTYKKPSPYNPNYSA